jgi:acetyl esterase/lipase
MTRTRFHPELRRIGRELPKSVITPFTLKFVRKMSKLQYRRVPRDVEVVEVNPDVRVWLYRPRLPAGGSGGRPGLLWLHGGGYLIGSPGQDDELCHRLSRELGAVVASVDYRLAPEHPYPAPLEDCYAALSWLSRLPGVDPSHVAIAGASAGGGLAAALSQLACDRGEVPVVAQLMAYPMLDDRTASRRGRDKPGQRVWDNASNRFAWAAYLRDADPSVAVPARRADLSGLPPAWIGVGTLDLFYEESLAYAERLTAAGVPCEVHVVDGAFHGFDGVLPNAKVSQAFFDSQCAMLHKALTAEASENTP